MPRQLRDLLVVSAMLIVLIVLVTIYIRRKDIPRIIRDYRLLRDLSDLGTGFRRWLAVARLKQVSRSMAAGSATIATAIITLLPILVEIATWRPEAAVPSAAIVIAVVAALVGWWSLRRLPPADYARIVAGGQSASDVLTSLAYEMLRLSHQFASDPDHGELGKASRTILAMRTADGLSSKFTDRELARLRARTDALGELMSGQQHQIQRILEMKKIAEATLGIPARRLCDHVLCFSPIVFSNRIRKYVDNWEDVLSLGNSSLGPGIFKNRIRALLKENQRISNQVVVRMEHLKQVIKYRDLHVYIHGFASEHSATSSVKTYAEALSVVGHLPPLEGDLTGPFGQHHPRHDEICQRMRFLLRVQRAHPGFDLHLSCMRACRVALTVQDARLEHLKASTASADEVTKATQSVAALGRKIGVLSRLEQHRYLHDLGAKEQAAVDEEASSRRIPDIFDTDNVVAQSQLQALSRVFDDVTAVIERSRDEIVANFKHELSARGKAASSGEILVVTHGYSKTVREVLQEFSRTVSYPNLRIFMITGLGGDTLDARLIEYELRHDDRTRHPLSSGSTDNLHAIIDGAKPFVIVVLGAECYDVDCRIVQSHGDIRSTIDRIKKERNGEVWVTAVAESFKLQWNLLTARTLYRDHLDWITIYPRNCVDTVITDLSAIDLIADVAQNAHPEHADGYIYVAEESRSAVSEMGLDDGILGSRMSERRQGGAIRHVRRAEEQW